MKFIHLSDLHFHSRDVDNVDALTTLQYIQEHYPQHNLIITGDIVDDGHEKQFQQAFKALEPFMGRIFIAPGNHDFGAVGNFFSQERAERFDEFLSKPLKQGGTFTGDQTPVVNLLREGDNLKAMLIALDTNLETEHPFDFACGEVGERQLGFLKTVLRDPFAKDYKKILFFHHHPFIHNDPFMELIDARQLMRSIYNWVDVVLFGHKHVMGRWEKVNGTSYILASDNSPGKKIAWEIVVTPDPVKPITVNELAIS
ncbi:MAG: metallophosphoesterase [Syntrophales bacterium]|nr:metallophosphoesterase [Syntrophales bacterium]MDD5640906.1 metallophosphoesterase [Syntrophales bacterium]